MLNWKCLSIIPVGELQWYEMIKDFKVIRCSVNIKILAQWQETSWMDKTQLTAIQINPLFYKIEKQK